MATKAVASFPRRGSRGKSLLRFGRRDNRAPVRLLSMTEIERAGQRRSLSRPMRSGSAPSLLRGTSGYSTIPFMNLT
jgi:hypothetical protein